MHSIATETAESEEALPPPTKYRRQDRTFKEVPNPTWKSDDRKKLLQNLAVHRAAIAKTILKSEPAIWTAESELSDAWMWDVPVWDLPA